MSESGESRSSSKEKEVSPKSRSPTPVRDELSQESSVEVTKNNEKERSRSTSHTSGRGKSPVRAPSPKSPQDEVMSKEKRERSRRDRSSSSDYSHKERSRSRERHRKGRSRSRSYSREREREIEERRREREKRHSRSRSRSREREKEMEERRREREKRHSRSRSRSREREKEIEERRREREKRHSRSRSRSREREKEIEERRREREKRHAERDRSDRIRSRRDRDRSSSPKRSRRDERIREESKEKEPEEPKPKKEPMDLLRTRAGGAYIPPAKLKLMQEAIADKAGEQYQRMNWERLKKKIHGLVNKVNTSNLVQIVRELLQENIIRGKGLLVRSIIQAQAFSPVFSHVYAALVAVINSKFPQIGELLLRRLVVQFKRSFRRNDKATTVTVSKFIAHLINQQVAHELLALEVMLLMLATPTDDSVEVAIAFLKECGMKLQDVAPRALDSIFTRLRNILAEAELDKRTRYMIEVAMAIRKEKFQAHPAIIDDLDLISEEDQITHTLALEDAVDPENTLNIFKFDDDFEKNEAAYNEIREQIIGDADDSDEEDEEESGEEDGEATEGQAQAGGSSAVTEIIDNTEQNLVAFRREVYLTIQSSLDFQEAAHKLLKMRVKKELEPELCHMLVDCCAQQRTYERFYGLLCERFCRLRKEFQATFEQIARDTYLTIHRFEITKLRNMARLISHLLITDAINWTILGDIKLNENDTTSSGRIYIKSIFQELSGSMGLAKLYERIKDPTLQSAFDGLFPRDNTQNTRFAINFFTLIGLGGLTVDLRAFLDKGLKKQQADDSESESSSSSSDSSSSDSSDGDSDSSSSSSSSSDSEDEKKKRKKKKAKGDSAEKRRSRKRQDSEKENTTAKVKVKEEIPSRESSPIDEKRGNRSNNKERTEDRRDDRERRRGSQELRSDRRREKSNDRGDGRQTERSHKRRERSRDREEKREKRNYRDDDVRKEREDERRKEKRRSTSREGRRREVRTEERERRRRE